ncbi:MAG: hypothetical protein ACT4OL_05255 [Nitrospiraceae bacterium]
MSGVYWGIVVGLVAMVATFFVCIEVVFSSTKGSSPGANSKVDQPKTVIPDAADSDRQAA